MRVRITFSVENRGATVPFHHQGHIAKVFKEALERHTTEYTQDYPFYSFSGLKGQTRLGKDGLKYGSKKVTIVVASANPDFIKELVNAVFSLSELSIGNLTITPDLVEEELPIDFESASKYLCISPLVTDRNNMDFISPTENEFSDALYESSLARMSAYGIDVDAIPDVQKFQLVPDADYMDRIKKQNKIFSRIYEVGTSKDNSEVRAYTFPFKLFAAREIQDFVYSCGLGDCCDLGFGMLDLANTDHTERTVPFLSKKSMLQA